MTHVQTIESPAISNNKKQQQMLMFLLAPFSVHHLFPTLCSGPLAKLSACADGRTHCCKNYGLNGENGERTVVGIVKRGND